MLSSTLRESLIERYSNKRLRDAVLSACGRYFELGLQESTTAGRLQNDDKSTFQQQMTEILLALHLDAIGLTPARRRGKAGPDLVIEYNCKRIWIEAVTPEPRGFPTDWQEGKPGTVFEVPHQDMLLRCTAALKSKIEAGRKYLNGILEITDCYVIAINGRLLRRNNVPSIEGISQLPVALEAVFGIGPIQIELDDNQKRMHAGHINRENVLNRREAAVPVNLFLTNKNAFVSAVWAVDTDETSLLGEWRPMAVIHNPHAINPLPVRTLPAYAEYGARPTKGSWNVHQLPGRLGASTSALSP